MTGTARCDTCFRTERRQDSTVLDVPTVGGVRRPALPGGLAAWRTLRGAQRPAVAACAGCGQPMFCIEGDLPAMPRWEVALPDGVVALGPDGRVIDADDAGDDDANRRVEAHFQAELDQREPPTQLAMAMFMFTFFAMIAGIIGLCDCSSVAAVAAGGAMAASARGGRRR
jgi:hypothetical protein